MPALLLVGLTLWYLLTMRFFLLRRKIGISFFDNLKSTSVSCRGALSAANASHQPHAATADMQSFELTVLILSNHIRGYRRVISSLCAIAPLLGLLGTVSGMIETFASLVTMDLFAQSGGVGGGISEALISTQMGLIIAVPGIVAGRLLQRKEERLVDEMHRLHQTAIQTVEKEALS